MARPSHDAGSMLPVVFAVIVGLHGAVHLIGFAKAFELVPSSKCDAVIRRPLGLLWLLAATSYIAAAVMLFAWPERWWVAGLIGLIASQTAIVTDWKDARFGTAINVIIVLPLAVALLDLRTASLRSVYRHEVDRGLTRGGFTATVTEGDVATLPPLLQTYLRRTGALDRPRVRDVRARWRGQMRNGRDAPWMDIHAEQYEFFDEPTRLFHMHASQHGIPFEALHVYTQGTATMRVRIASVLNVVDARGPEMNRSETVTLFNDMCLLAPGSLVDAKVAWRTLDDHTLSGTFTNAGNTVSAELSFDAEGDLVDFISRDRDQSADGVTYRNLPWSTPVRDYRDFGGGLRVAGHGEAVWHEPEGDFAYAHFDLEDLQINVGGRSARPASARPGGPLSTLPPEGSDHGNDAPASLVRR
ncbi:MAG: hypothetical protein JWO86_4882 [Myxococcaceae bacterium]|nr:hypothetical protein [Myxococcaceae bacterium]